MSLNDKLRSKFIEEKFPFSNDEVNNLFFKLRTVISSYNCDDEAFYSQFYALLSDKLVDKFDGIINNTLLLEVDNYTLVHPERHL